MGTSGGGSGGGGSGGAGGGGAGSRGGSARKGRRRAGRGYAAHSSSGSSSKAASSQGRGGKKSTRRTVAQVVLGRLKPAYLEAQFASDVPSGLVRELTLLKTHMLVNKSWKEVCTRLGLPADASPADIRDAILAKRTDGEGDVRVRETATASVLSYFEELCTFNDDVLYGPGNNSTITMLDHDVLDRPLETFLRLQYVNVLQREEPHLLDFQSQDGLENVAAEMANAFAHRLRHRYGSKDQSSAGEFLQRAGADDEARTWLLKAIRG